MAKLPYSRVVNVNLTRSDAFPSRRGFGIPLILTTTAVAGILDGVLVHKPWTRVQIDAWWQQNWPPARSTC